MSVVLNVWEELVHAIPEEALLNLLFDGFKLLKDYLGGKGSRGSGQVKIGIETITKTAVGDLNASIPATLKYDPTYAAAVYGYPGSQLVIPFTSVPTAKNWTGRTTSCIPIPSLCHYSGLGSAGDKNIPYWIMRGK